MFIGRKCIAYAKESALLFCRSPRRASLGELAGCFRRWAQRMDRPFGALEEAAPSLVFGTQEFLKSRISRDAHVFEYGSGGSTLFFANLASTVVSVEHDPKWFELVQKALSEKGRRNVTQILVEPDPGIAQPNGGENLSECYLSSNGQSFRAYVESIDRFPRASFDVILVDGRARPACVKHSLSRLKPGGYLILDDADRSHYALAIALLEKWELTDLRGPAPYTGYFSRTAIWRRPLAD